MVECAQTKLPPSNRHSNNYRKMYKYKCIPNALRNCKGCYSERETKLVEGISERRRKLAYGKPTSTHNFVDINFRDPVYKSVFYLYARNYIFCIKHPNMCAIHWGRVDPINHKVRPRELIR